VKQRTEDKDDIWVDCYDIKYSLKVDYDIDVDENGVYTIFVGPEKRRIRVYCDMTTAGGGWTVCIRKYLSI